MEAIELEKGWLERQMEEVRSSAKSWPDVMKPITSINASLVHQPASTEGSSGSSPRGEESEKS